MLALSTAMVHTGDPSEMQSAEILLSLNRLDESEVHARYILACVPNALEVNVREMLADIDSRRKTASSTVFPGNSELPFIYVQRGQSVTLFPVVEASKLIALQSLLTLLEHVQLRAALKCLVQDQGDAVANLREGERRGPFFSPERFLAPGTM